jgi:hypothetical protein
MRKIIRILAKTLGFKRSYQVAATYVKSGQTNGWSTVSLIVTMRPWLHVDNYKDLVQYVEESSDSPSYTPVIINISRLGV